jgi:GNAT superfamily N-acetyltransferase
MRSSGTIREDIYRGAAKPLYIVHKEEVVEFKKVIKPFTFRKLKEMVSAYNDGAGITGRYYAAVEDGVIKGCVGILFRSWYMSEIRHLFVSPEFRQNGVGGFLIEEALKKIKTPLAVSTVRADNPVSIRLFQNAGFYILEKVVNQETGHKILLMVKKMELNT